MAVARIVTMSKIQARISKLRNVLEFGKSDTH